MNDNPVSSTMPQAEPSAPAPETARLRILRISTRLFVDLFSPGRKQTYEVIENGIPEGTHVRNVRYGWPDCIELLLEHESFDEVQVGQEYPVMLPTIVRNLNLPIP